MPSFAKIWRNSRVPSCGAVIVAAGRSERMKGIDKITAEIGGKAVISWTLRAFETCHMINEIIVVTREDLIPSLGELCRRENYSKVSKIVKGGPDRTHSVQNGIQELDRSLKLIAIHDGARPFVSRQVLERTITAAAKSAAAAPALPLTDTVKLAVDGVVTETPDRSTLFAVQTPQIFDADLIRCAIHDCLEKGISLTDDCAAVERLGKQIQLTCGDAKNIKITTQLDLKYGEVILSCRDAI